MIVSESELLLLRQESDSVRFVFGASLLETDEPSVGLRQRWGASAHRLRPAEVQAIKEQEAGVCEDAGTKAQDTETHLDAFNSLIKKLL